MRRIFWLLIISLVLLIGVSFTALNAEPVGVNYYFNQAKMPLSLLLVIAMGFGMVLGLMVALKVYVKSKFEMMNLKHRAHKAEDEVENLRAIPLRNQH